MTEKVLASAVYDAFKASAAALGGSPDAVQHAVEQAFLAAAERFMAVHGARFPNPRDAFVWRAENLERALETVRFSARRLSGSDLSPLGINGAPAATPEELEFFATALYDALAAQPGLDGRLFMNAVLERLDRIAANTAPDAQASPRPAWSHDQVARLSAQVRRVLNPSFLERVPRALVGREYLPALRDVLARGTGMVLAIVGPAGYGKTTLLGQLYDEVHSLEPGWIAAMLSAEVHVGDGAGVDDLEREMGRALCGAPVPLAEVARGLNAARGPGVLLIDTLDLILSEGTARGLRHILSGVARTGACVVVTCRDYEYELLSPADAPSGRAEAFARFKVLWFTDDEVRLAARRLIERKPPERRIYDPAMFAERLLALSADSRPLRHLVHNPLLLSLVCELFDDALAIPEDLTISRLYDRYWDERVARGRAAPVKALGTAKATLALRLAAILFHRSGELLIENVRPEDVRRTHELEERGFGELLSEGVFTLTDRRRLRFFHQTFLEYAIARWLMAGEQGGERDALLASLRTPEGRTAIHWWQVVRQLLAIAEPSEFQSLLRQLDLRDLAAFRVVALAAVSAENADVLLALLDHAVEGGPGFRKALLFALGAPTPAFFLPAWSAALRVLRASTSTGEAMQAIEPVGALLAVASKDPALRLREAMGALERLEPGEPPERGAAPGPGVQRSIALGTFLNGVSEWLHAHPDDDLLAVLREHYPLMGNESRALLLRLHLLSAASDTARDALLRQLIEQPIPAPVAEDAVPLFTWAAPWGPRRSTVPFASWSEALHAVLPDGWNLVRGRSSGRAILHDADLLRRVVDDFFHGLRPHIDMNILALHCAILAGGGDAVCNEIVRTPPEVPGRERMSGVSGLVRHVASSLSARQRAGVREWLRRIPAGPGSLPWVISVSVLADDEDSLSFATARLAELAPNDRVRAVEAALDVAPRETGRALYGWVTGQPGFRPYTGQADDLRLALDRLEARHQDARAVSRIVQAAADPRKELAQAAANALMEFAAGPVAPRLDELVPLARSKWPVVRKNALLVARAQLEAGFEITEAGLLSLLDAFAGDTDRMVVHTFCELAARWITLNGSAPARVGEIVAGFVARLVPEKTFDGGVARVVAYVYRMMSEVGDAALRAKLRAWGLDLMRVMGRGHLDNAQANVQGLLVAIGRADPAFFPAVIGLGPSLPARGVRTLVMAIGKVEGSRSPLLADLLRTDWCPPEVKGLIMGLRGT